MQKEGGDLRPLRKSFAKIIKKSDIDIPWNYKECANGIKLIYINYYYIYLMYGWPPVEDIGSNFAFIFA